VRLRGIHAKAFGVLKDLDLQVASDVVVVFGPNESGKSSFRSALETIFFGFDPATREGHPLYGWDDGAGGDLHLEAELVLADGVRRVERVLQSTGRLRLAAEGEAFEGRREGNRPLACVGETPRDLYKTIYSLELEQLQALGQSVQAHVDDLLLPEAQAMGLRSTSEVRKELSTEHLGLWRPDRRGQPHARQLSERLHEARARVDDAAAHDQELRAAQAERPELEAWLEELREQKRRLEREREEAPYLRDLFELHQRERRHTPVDLSGLGDLPLRDPAELQRDIQEIEELLAPARTSLEGEPEKLAPEERAVLEAEHRIEAARAAAREHGTEQDLRDRSLVTAEARRTAAARELSGALARTAAEPDLAAAARIPVEALRSLQARWAEAWERSASASPTPGQRRGLLAAALALGALTVAVMATLSWLPGWASFGALALGALAGLAFRRAAPRPAAPPDRPVELSDLLADIPIVEPLLARPADVGRLVEAIARVQGILGEAADAEGEAKRLATRGEARETSWRELCAGLGIGVGDADDPVALLGTSLTTAQQSRARVERDEEERRRAQELLEKQQPVLSRRRAHLEAVMRALRAAEPETTDPGEAFARVEARRQETRSLGEERARLARDGRWTRLCHDSRARAESEPEDAPWHPDLAQRRQESIAACQEKIDATHERIGEIGRALGDDPGSHRARALDEVTALEEELRETRRERDRLALLDSILAVAERCYREEHQPDVMRRAGEHLERMTLGRYHRLDYLEGADGGLHVSCRGRAEPIPVAPPISRGTLDQIFLALRLGLLDHLDAGREMLPLVLDDALLRMDDDRRPAVYRLLTAVSARRQVFLLTCHRALAEEAQRALGAARVDLTLRA
jgi:uncharacterized protein YhaN